MRKWGKSNRYPQGNAGKPWVKEISARFFSADLAGKMLTDVYYTPYPKP
jgi:hypothetical protein